MITEEDVEKALAYLGDSAQESAQWTSAKHYYDKKLKRIESLEFMKEEKGAVESKRMAARASEEYGNCLEDYREAAYNAELLDARREAARMTISLHQTQVKAKMGAY